MLLQNALLCGTKPRQAAQQQQTFAAAMALSVRARARCGASAVAAASLGGPSDDAGARQTQRVVMDPRTKELRQESPYDLATSSGRRAAGLAEYAALKSELLQNTAKVGTATALYLLLTQHDVSIAASTELGVGGGVAYLALLCRHVDGLGASGAANVRGLPLQRNPGADLGALMLGALKRVGDIYVNALAHPQLLVPVALAAGGAAWNASDAGPDVQFIYVLLGFLSYKAAVLDQAYKALKRVTIFAAPPVERPVLKELPDIDNPY